MESNTGSQNQSADSAWTKASTIATCVALLTVFSAFAAYMVHHVRRVRQRDEGILAADVIKMGSFAVDYVPWWSALFGRETESVNITSIEGLIQAGDSSLWTSADMYRPHPQKSDIHWVQLYERVFSEITRRHQLVGQAISRALAPNNIPAVQRINILVLDMNAGMTMLPGQNMGLGGLNLLEKARAWWAVRRMRRLILENQSEDGWAFRAFEQIRVAADAIVGPAAGNPQAIQYRIYNIQAVGALFQSMECEYSEVIRKHLRRALSVRQPDLPLGAAGLVLDCCRLLPTLPNAVVNPRTGIGRADTALLLDRKPHIKVSREELAALCLVLGISLRMHKNTLSLSGAGGFGTTVFADQDGNGNWRLRIDLGSESHYYGSGYSVLMAKHIACGSLPFGEDQRWIRSIHVTSRVLSGIKRGHSVQDIPSVDEESLSYLHALPQAKWIDAYSGTGRRLDGQDMGAILEHNMQPILAQAFLWHKAVVGIAFGGLVPQATNKLAEAVMFTVGAPEGDKLQDLVIGLQNLMISFHDRNANAILFGYDIARMAEQNVPVAHPLPGRYDNTSTATAMFSKYSTLLGRVAALYNGALYNKVEGIYQESCAHIQDIYTNAVNNNMQPSLVEQLRNVINDINTQNIQNVQNTLNSQQRSTVVRCILAVWASKVPTVDLRLRARDSDLLQFSPVALQELPPVLALG
ncbi:hypothetical protein B0O99DRAFT_599496 [Bisporella sp. PMI_857]|nr:hypothetical protein B0O99DRAFT_599496 [Bisporella sp. PMI_857]